MPIEETWLPRSAQSIIAMLIGLWAWCCSSRARTWRTSSSRAPRPGLASSPCAPPRRLPRPGAAPPVRGVVAAGPRGRPLCHRHRPGTFDWMAAASAGRMGRPDGPRPRLACARLAFGICLFTVLCLRRGPRSLRPPARSEYRSQERGRGTTGDRGHRASVTCDRRPVRARHGPARGRRPLRARLARVEHRQYGWESDSLVTGSWCFRRAPTRCDQESRSSKRRALGAPSRRSPGVASASMSYDMPFFGLSEPASTWSRAARLPHPGHEPAAVIKA